MAASVGYLVIDSINPPTLAASWCAMLDTAADTTIAEGEFLVLAPTANGPAVGFQRVTEHKAGKNRLHLGLVVADIGEAAKEAERLGGQWLEPRNYPVNWRGFTWRCMADPESNEFDIDVLPAA